jgi:signal transduction histidine kinase/DNA-binding LacI/PurR family transcriptional regulator/AraC-like DNA-binding protein
MLHNYRHGRPTIGVLAGWQYYWTATPLSYLNPIFRGILQGAHDLGCHVLLGCGMGPSAALSDPIRPAWPVLSSEADFVPIGPWNTEGLIAVNPLHSQARSRYLQDVIAAGHPVVFIGSGEHGPAIVADNASGILQAMQHLVEHGHQRIAFIAGSLEDIEGDTGDRLRAYQSVLQRYNLAADQRLVAYGRHVYTGGYAAMRQILDSGVAFTAVMASNDESALGAVQALQEAGRSIPRDVALVGFDDRPESAVQEPALSTVHVPLFKMGYCAVELLLQRIEGRTETIEPVKVATRLMVRESCGCGRSNIFGDVFDATAQQPESLEVTARPSPLAYRMAASVLSEAQSSSSDEVLTWCQRLVETFMASVEQNDGAGFLKTIDRLVRQVVAGQDDAHLWQAAISMMHIELPKVLATWSQPATRDLARDVLDQARVALSAAMQRQHRQYVVNERWTANRIGVLTARLLAALDETQVFEVLAWHLPEMGIHTASVALFEADRDDPVAWSVLRNMTAPTQATIRFRSREFPPSELVPGDEPVGLALLPLVNPRGQLGFVAFDTAQLDLYGAIVQQLAAALNTAQLYREATEGRRLAEEANQLKSRFLSTVSHELRTPLNLIVGLCGILLQESDESGTPLPETYHKDVERIHANAQHLGWLIGDVLDLASSEAGQLRLANEFVDLNQALRMVVETGRQLAHDKGLVWRTVLPESGPWVWGDRTRLRQVALNLVNNAIKFTARGQVSLTLQVNDDTVTVAVRDTGLGIPPEEQALIFNEFRRSERSVTRGYGGLGLGLAICKLLVERHGGTIGVQSSGEEGAGSTFYFTLPTVQPPAVQAERPAISRVSEQSVFVVAQRSGSGERLREHLNQRGFEVQMALMDEMPDWLARLAILPPGAIVLDMSVAPEQGWVTLKAIKGNPVTQGIPVLFYSLSQDSGSVLELDYLTKPIELAELTRALDQHWLAGNAEQTAKTILVVDDDVNTLDMHTRIVQSHSASHRVLKARNGREALDILQHEHADLVLLDLMMPELDGFGVLEAMREQLATRDIPVIVLTGQVLTEKDMTRLNRGVATVLSKGLFSAQETLEHVDAALERKRKLSGEAQRVVRHAMAYLHEHYAESLSRQDLARHVGMNDDYLTFCFRQELGMTPIVYLNRYRVNQAKQLLTDTHKSITEIALEVGFSDSGYFSRIFRREVGLSPEGYRRA